MEGSGFTLRGPRASAVLCRSRKSVCKWQPRAPPALHREAPRRGWPSQEAAIRAGPGLPSSRAGQQNHPQPAQSSCQLAELERSDGLPAEQRQLQVRARLRRPADSGAQRAPGAAHHLLRLLRVPGGATPAGPDSLWPRVSVGWLAHPAGRDAGEAEGTRWVGIEEASIGETNAELRPPGQVREDTRCVFVCGWGRLHRIVRARQSWSGRTGTSDMHCGTANFD